MYVLRVSNLLAFCGIFATFVFPLSHQSRLVLSVCASALKIKCSAPRRSAVNLLQMLVKTSGDIFTCDVPGKKEKKESVWGTAEYFNDSATRGEISTWIYMLSPNDICHWKNDVTNLHSMKVNSINETQRWTLGKRLLCWIIYQW